jgi:hypothetical protein
VSVAGVEVVGGTEVGGTEAGADGVVAADVCTGGLGLVTFTLKVFDPPPQAASMTPATANTAAARSRRAPTTPNELGMSLHSDPACQGTARTATQTGDLAIAFVGSRPTNICFARYMARSSMASGQERAWLLS